MTNKQPFFSILGHGASPAGTPLAFWATLFNEGWKPTPGNSTAAQGQLVRASHHPANMLCGSTSRCCQQQVVVVNAHRYMDWVEESDPSASLVNRYYYPFGRALNPVFDRKSQETVGVVELNGGTYKSDAPETW